MDGRRLVIGETRWHYGQDVIVRGAPLYRRKTLPMADMSPHPRKAPHGHGAQERARRREQMAVRSVE